MKLSDIKGERALEVLADLIEPMASIMSDEIFVADVRAGKKLLAIKRLLKEHKTEVVEVLAVLHGEDPTEYQVNLLTLPLTLLEILNDPDVMELFQSQEQNMGATSFGPATETTEATETE